MQLVIRASASATALRAAPLAGLVLLMAWFQGTNTEGVFTWWGYICLGLAALIAAPAAANLFWPPMLLLGSDALVCRWWWTTTTVPWTDIEAFRVISPSEQLSRRVPHFLPWNAAISRVGTRAKIGFDYRKGVTLSPAQQRAMWSSQSVNLCDWAVPNLWSVPATELVRRLNDHLASERKP